MSSVASYTSYGRFDYHSTFTHRISNAAHLARSCFLEAGIFISHIIWLIQTREIRRSAAARGKTFDDIALEHEQSGTPFRFAERKSCRDIKYREKEDVDVEQAGVRGSVGDGQEQEQSRSDDAAGQSSFAGDGPVLDKNAS